LVECFGFATQVNHKTIAWLYLDNAILQWLILLFSFTKSSKVKVLMPFFIFLFAIDKEKKYTLNAVSR